MTDRTIQVERTAAAAGAARLRAVDPSNGGAWANAGIPTQGWMGFPSSVPTPATKRHGTHPARRLEATIP